MFDLAQFGDPLGNKGTAESTSSPDSEILTNKKNIYTYSFTTIQ